MKHRTRRRESLLIRQCRDTCLQLPTVSIISTSISGTTANPFRYDRRVQLLLRKEDNMGTLQHPSASNLSASVNPRGASQRAVSLPIKLTNGTGPRRSSNHTESEGVEILFSHDSGKVVAFSPPGQTSQLGSRSSSQNQESGEEKAGILPWSSRTERTICAGRF